MLDNIRDGGRGIPRQSERVAAKESVMSPDDSAFAFAIAKAVVVVVCSVGAVLSFAFVGAKRIFK